MSPDKVQPRHMQPTASTASPSSAQSLPDALAVVHAYQAQRGCRLRPRRVQPNGCPHWVDWRRHDPELARLAQENLAPKSIKTDNAVAARPAAQLQLGAPQLPLLQQHSGGQEADRAHPPAGVAPRACAQGRAA